jgi:hypothetical protein
MSINCLKYSGRLTTNKTKQNKTKQKQNETKTKKLNNKTK